MPRLHHRASTSPRPPLSCADAMRCLTVESPLARGRPTMAGRAHAGDLPGPVPARARSEGAVARRRHRFVSVLASRRATAARRRSVLCRRCRFVHRKAPPRNFRQGSDRRPRRRSDHLSFLGSTPVSNRFSSLAVLSPTSLRPPLRRRDVARARPARLISHPGRPGLGRSRPHPLWVAASISPCSGAFFAVRGSADSSQPPSSRLVRPRPRPRRSAAARCVDVR